MLYSCEQLFSFEMKPFKCKFECGGRFSWDGLYYDHELICEKGMSVCIIAFCFTWCCSILLNLAKSLGFRMGRSNSWIHATLCHAFDL